MQLVRLLSVVILAIAVGCTQSDTPSPDSTNEGSVSPEKPLAGDSDKQEQLPNIEEAIDTIKSAGGTVHLSDPNVVTTHQMLNADAMLLASLERTYTMNGAAVKVEFRRSKATDDTLQHLTDFRQLEYLGIANADISGSGLVHLSKSKLCVLYAIGSSLDDEGLKSLKGLGDLQLLFLTRTKVTDDGLPALSQLPALHGLSLGGLPISDSGVANLKELTQLKGLDLDSTNVTDSGVASLKALSSLTALSLRSTNVTDECLDHIASIRGLEKLSLSGTKISDAGLQKLHSLEKLKELYVVDTSVTDVGVAAIKSALPEVEVTQKF